jgi:hypothetical protein
VSLRVDKALENIDALDTRLQKVEALLKKAYAMEEIIKPIGRPRREPNKK